MTRFCAHYCNFLRLLWLAMVVVWGISCSNHRVFEGKVDFPNQRWYADSTCSFTFSIANAQNPYTIYYTLRNSANFASYNLFIKITLKDSKGTVLRSDLQELQLMDAETGYPFGSGMGDWFTHKIKAYSSFKFPEPGVFTITLVHYMRHDPVSELFSVGINIESEPQK